MMEFGDPQHDLKDAVIYTRVSAKSQTKRGQGLESQATLCRQYAQWKGYTVWESFCDRGLTGAKADRDGMKELLAFLKQNKGKTRFVVIIDDISRLARDIRVHWDLRDAIADYGAVMESPNTIFGTNSHGRYAEGVQALHAQYTREENAERTRARMTARLLNGYWPFQVSLGYKWKKAPEGGKIIVPCEPLASIIREALEGYATGRFQTQAEVKRFLESKPEFPRTKYGAVTNEHVNTMLTRPIYAGYVEAPDWGVSRRPGKHEGLISKETFERIQQRLQDGAKVPARANIDVDFPLRGFVACGDCGKPLTSCWSKSKTGKRHPYYMCFDRECGSSRKSIPRADIESEFEAILRATQPTETMSAMAKAMFTKAWNIHKANTVDAMTALRRQLSEIEKKTQTLLDRIVDASNDSVVQAYEKRISDLEKEGFVIQEKLENEPKPSRPFNEMFELAMQFFANPWNIWRSGNLEHKRMVLNLTFEDRLAYCRKTGFRTPKTTLLFNVLERLNMQNLKMARPAGFEPAAPGLGILCSILLSYGRGAGFGAGRPRGAGPR